MNKTGDALKKETGLVQFPTNEIETAAENSLIYDTFTPANQDDQDLVESIAMHGILAPLHISADGVLLSGHRRLAAARQLGLETVPAIIEDVDFYELDRGQKIKILASFNKQRCKSFSEMEAEAMAELDPDEVSREVRSYQAKRRAVSAERNVVMGSYLTRPQITTAQFLEAVQAVVFNMENEWPISNRAIHYMLLNDPPLTHDAKPNSYYQNELKYSKKLSSLLTRARIAGLIPMNAICDEERATVEWRTNQQVGNFVKTQYEGFLRGYQRDLMQSQKNHIEIVVEKRTKFAAARRVAMNYTIPVTAGKGYASLPPRYQMSQRFAESGKENLIIIFLTDFDPDGEQIASSFARSMRDDFEILDVFPIKASVTGQQVNDWDLPSSLEAKPTSPNYKKFIAEHGTRAVELDAVPGEQLEHVLHETIHSVIDIPAFNYEVEQEDREHIELAAKRRGLIRMMGAES